LIPVPVTWNGFALTANIRWERHAHRRCGNNRILEVDRPLVRTHNPNTGLDLAAKFPTTNYMLAQGYRYLSGYHYLGPDGLTQIKLVQQTGGAGGCEYTGIHSAATRASNALFGKPIDVHLGGAV